MANCTICSNSAEKFQNVGGAWLVECPRCGTYIATAEFCEVVFLRNLGSATKTLSPEQVGNASGWIRENQGCTLREADWDWLRKLPTPSVGEKADKLLLFIAATYSKPGTPIELHDTAGHVKPELLGAAWAENDDELRWLFREYLAGKHLVISGHNKAGVQDAIAPDGWDYLHRLRSVNPDSRIGFCAMWFDASLSELHQAIADGIAEAGFRPQIMDRVEHNNRIDDEIVASIRRSRFVVADFTHGDKGVRGGVYFEAGFGLGLGLPVIHTCRQDMLDKIHFDNRQYNFVTWEADKLADFKARLVNRITVTVGTGERQRK